MTDKTNPLTPEEIEEVPSISIWFCETCLESGAFAHEPELDLWSGFQMTLDSHRRRSPECQGDKDTIRILKGAMGDVKAIAVALAGEERGSENE